MDFSLNGAETTVKSGRDHLVRFFRVVRLTQIVSGEV